MTDPNQITRLLKSAQDGDSRAVDAALPLVYEELRALAEAKMRIVGPGQTLQPTALVHEAYLKVIGENDSNIENRAHFFFVAARAMRDILVDQARRKSAIKRGGDRKRVSGENLAVAIEAPAEDMLALSAALKEMESEYPRQHQLVMLRFFAGMTTEQAAEILEVSDRTAERDWRFARAHLHAVLTENRDA